MYPISRVLYFLSQNGDDPQLHWVTVGTGYKEQEGSATRHSVLFVMYKMLTIFPIRAIQLFVDMVQACKYAGLVAYDFCDDDGGIKSCLEVRLLKQVILAQ